MPTKLAKHRERFPQGERTVT